jgi:uncharacterized protein (UPF0276 family)
VYADISALGARTLTMETGTPSAAIVKAGIGLRLSHMAEIAATPSDPALPWLEIHSETFMCDGGPRLALLDAIAAHTPISCHGVGLSLGSAEGLSTAHLERLRRLHTRLTPALVSEHLSWSITGGDYLNDLLPLPYTAETLDVVCRNVDQAQAALGRVLLVENPSAYLTFPATVMSEPDFLNTLVARTGCGVLLDVNNIYVTACNTAGDDPLQTAHDYIDRIDAHAVGEIHLAGHSIVENGDDRIRIDTHSTHVCDDVWSLYQYTLARLGPRPTLIEWDQDLPALSMLRAEAARAQAILDHAAERRHVA